MNLHRTVLGAACLSGLHVRADIVPRCVWQNTATAKDEGADREVVGMAAVGNAPDGSGTKTYKELCSLVNDMGQVLLHCCAGVPAGGSCPLG
jgi:hypothetical protein